MTTVAYLVLLIPPLASPAQPPIPAQREPDELRLQQLGIAPESSHLLELVRHRVSPPETEAIRAAIESVLTKPEPERGAALVKLLGAGSLALPYLRQAGREHPGHAGDPFRVLAQALEQDGPTCTTAMVRLLARKAPEGAAQALLDLAPTVEDFTILIEIRAALTELSRAHASHAAVLRGALQDPLAQRRALAIDAFTRALPGEFPPELKNLLDDPVPLVRLRAALALARTHEEAVGRLIALLGELPVDLAQEAEEFLQALAQDHGGRPLLTDKPESRIPVRDAWQKWWSENTSDVLLQELRKRTLLETDQEKADLVIRQLGAEDFETREQATQALKELGPRIRSLLRNALKSPDAEVVQRASAVLESFARENVVPLPPHVPRMLALRRPAGVIEAILAYLPFNEEDGLIEEFILALEQIARLQPTNRKLLIAALDDSFLPRRMVALEALGRLPNLESLAPIRRCLEDREVSVRLRAALALLRHRERAAVPVLLAQVSTVVTSEDERLLDDFLNRLCEGLPRPTLTSGNSEEARRKRQEEWQKWWQENEAQVSLPRYDLDTNLEMVRGAGLTLAVLNGNGIVVAYDNELRERWQLRGLSNPHDAQMLAGERVLVAEYDLRRVTERNLQGEILWEKKVSGNPIQIERLPSGNTFIVCRDQLLEVTRTGREVTTIPRPQGDIYTARRFRDGTIACLSNQGRVIRLDSRGNEISSFRVPNGLAHMGNEMLPSGGVLIPISWQNKITEYDREGKMVKEHAFATPVAVQRLQNGNLLVLSQQWPPRLVELDRTGQIVRETKLAANALRAVRR
jgi:HEAT repeat protein